MQVTDIPLDLIRPYWRNPRNPARAVEAVKRSITDYGFLQPLVIDAENVIIAGHTRYRALLELGHETAPCIRADLPLDRAKAYRIADNKTSELSGWDMDALVAELRELGDLADIQATYFAGVDLDRMMNTVKSYAEVTVKQIERQERDLANQFTDASIARQAAYIDVICPHCTTTFALDAGELASKLK